MKTFNSRQTEDKQTLHFLLTPRPSPNRAEHRPHERESQPRSQCFMILGYDLIEWLMDRLCIEDSRKC